jgi:4-oxalocrotonate tautomerase
MPVIRVSMYEGRSPEKKRQLAKALTDAMVEIAGSKREGVHVIFDEVSRQNWAIGGALSEDAQR